MNEAALVAKKKSDDYDDEILNSIPDDLIKHYSD
jgi:hypothetical protein